VLVPTLVLDRNERPVYSLPATDFRVTDDGVLQRITLDDKSGGEPLALVIAVETGGAAARKVEIFRHLGTAIQALVGDRPSQVALVSFDSAPHLVQPFTPGVQGISEALDELEPGDHGAALFDAMAFSVALLREQPLNYRRVILFLSETIDRGSQTRLPDALRAISDANTLIETLAFSSARAHAKNTAAHTFQPHTPGPAGGCMADDPNPEAEESSNKLQRGFDCLTLLAPPLRLAQAAAQAGLEGLRRNVPETMARLTGGEYARWEDERSLVAGILAFSNHLPNRYLLSFQPHEPHAGYHSVEVLLPDYPSLHLAARNGYWVDKKTSRSPED
jgi:VWFA-related protein